ncbi:MAG: hypothetical protein JO366_01545 [Methylobacteriaceae bacterium]|nr:hypothetical protein [Methylobacteriaceae bacterium]MBV9219032.1 hypothetical protein [Methylobacteriaceae bacterium]MBV9243476.1 hypothetical protein [Methylobacteriaceae bacterium]MBV9636258.1 hypothetical protein [Methylobacteriaceae bacterium]MBV9704448.1 hypothetical protein [Methylobacteriaceae bacterium]
MTTTVTGLFDSYDTARRVVSDLEAAGIPDSDISIIASNVDVEDVQTTGTETGAAVGAVLGGGAGLLAGLGMLAIPGLGPVVAAGWLASTAVGAVAGGAAGGIVGSLTDAGVSEKTANVYAEGVRRGGTLLSARVDDNQAGIARSIIASNNPVDPEARDIAYRDTGWTRFDETAPPYNKTDTTRDRSLH